MVAKACFYHWCGLYCTKQSSCILPASSLNLRKIPHKPQTVKYLLYGHWKISIWLLCVMIHMYVGVLLLIRVETQLPCILHRINGIVTEIIIQVKLYAINK